MSVITTGVDRRAAVAWYQQNRARTRALFDLIRPAAYYARPIALRNPIVFYEGHLPAFSIISFINRGLGRPGIDPRLEALFARGIDPESENDAVPRSGADTRWPSREQVLQFAAAADALVIDALQTAPFDESRPAMRHLEALYTALEHEAMHQETLAYMWNRLPHDQKIRPTYLPYETRGVPPAPATVVVPAGHATLGSVRGRIPFGWDNEFDEHAVYVEPFDVDVHSVTNGDYLRLVDGGHVEPPAFWIRKDGEWYWRGMFEDIPLPLSWPV
jgi:iron(II)-dependent oxidoreductase